jgi:hypothetical protein
MHNFELTLAGLGNSMITSSDEETRLTSGYYFVKTLNRALRTPQSYLYPFDSLKHVSVLKSPDNHFRIITWNIVLKGDNFKYFGVIQMNPDYMKTIKDTQNLRAIYPLIDRSDKIYNALDTTVSSEHWYGCLYYKIVANTYKNKTYYTLLGWDGNTMLSNKKLADVLYFDGNRPFFGAPIFNMNLKKNLSRLVFEFNNSASMLLRYEEKRKILVYENLSPPRQDDYDKPQTFLPNGSYEYFVFKKGVWEKQKNGLTNFNFSE